MTRYASSAAFKQALEARLRSSSSSGADFARRRQLLVFHRFLARVVRELGDRVILKGGVVVELRVERGRTTKDIDLRLGGSPVGVLDRLKTAAAFELGDFMIFNVNPDAAHPEITNEGMVYEGQRYRVTCKLAGKPYGQPFGLDVAFADPIFGEPDIVVANNILGFAGVAPPSLRVYPLETHIAEKLHAYTLPRARPNSRVKDLPDIALLAGVREIDGAGLRAAFEQTFSSRKTHALPSVLPEPPRSWAAVYARMVIEDELRWPDISALVQAVETFLNPALAGEVRTWRPSYWSWR
ncbi:nucleotidyl transferase AbiEii/AbiGii toxin family protein [Pendulispora albinea]|uniref:Nucleotidyl transferase AbiEii/AbiGii toxin family protein n=1 Tax=Pendulispora albinea TaxID=2741071 RepID=A0ABZ2LXC3_9BACT